jgi:thymidylate synthase ThyX
LSTSAKIIADSISPDGVRITTFELEFPRIILAEFNTHRLFSRNAASTRAIPLTKQLDYLVNRHFEPCPFTKNKPGMASNEPCDHQEEASKIWSDTMGQVSDAVSKLNDLGVSKQHAGRLLEPFTMIKVVVTATEYDNFFWLRNHPDAQPEIAELARVMWEEYNECESFELKANEWHVPYYREGFWAFSQTNEYDVAVDDYNVTLADALAISASCCAQVSYRKLDDSMEKARDIFKRLVESKPVHASPFEHQATPLTYGMAGDIQVKGTTHFDNKGNAWSGNFRQWVQHRQLIPDHTCWEYKP